jgi:hypothetical protein
MPDHEPLSAKPQAPADWRELAQEATQEPDGKKLLEIVRRICDTLDREDEKRRGPQAEAALDRGGRLQEGESPGT